MKRLIIFMLVVVFAVQAFGEDDDSTPYMPFPETQPQTQSAPAPAKKSTTNKKKAPAKKKTITKKQTPKKASKPKAPARPSSLGQGIELMKQERYEKAKPYLLKAIQEDRNNPNVWYWYGVYHEKTGGFYQAQYFYSKAITIDPAFEPLSRVVYYPEDSEKTPLWDPKRPARVYPVEVAAVPQNRSSFPTAPNDPELPRVPVYTPPEPGSSPLDGDAWSPAVYVPPRPEEVQTEGEMSPVYLPPEATSIVAQERQTLEVPMSQYEEDYTTYTRRPLNYDDTVRADKPLYNPPRPGEERKTPAVPKQSVQAKPQQAKPQETTPQRKASVPDTRIVRQNTKAKTKAKPAPAATTTTRVQRQQPARRNRTASRDVRPQTTQQVQPQAPARAPEPITLPPEPETRPAPQQQYLPPVGQYAPDPGTISETPIPPVGQGNNY